MPNLVESLDSGHTTVRTENSQPGLDQGQDPSSRVPLRSTRVCGYNSATLTLDRERLLPVGIPSSMRVPLCDGLVELALQTGAHVAHHQHAASRP